MLIYLCVQTRFLYLVAKYFFSIFEKAGFNMALMGETGVPNKLNDTVAPWGLILRQLYV